MKILLLTQDAFGGHGGIALYNRDLVRALASLHSVTNVSVVLRNRSEDCEIRLPNVSQYSNSSMRKISFICCALRFLLAPLDLLICGHINLLPVAIALKLKLRVPLILLVYGVDAWQRRSILTRHFLRHVNVVWSISALTRDRMENWARLGGDVYRLLPNAIDLSLYGEGPRRVELQRRFGLEQRKVVMTLGRLSSADQYKGVDEVLEVMPELLGHVPALSFVIAGDGDDRTRLEAKASRLGVRDHVVFTGFVDESEKADVFRLADVFVMPGRGEGFGFVFLEAMACGIPVIASNLDGSREAVRDGLLGTVINPDDRRQLVSAIMKALETPRGVPPGLEYFAFPRFQHRVNELIGEFAARRFERRGAED